MSEMRRDEENHARERKRSGYELDECGCGRSRRRRLSIWMLWDELLYDIANRAYVDGHVMGEDSEHGRHMTMDIAEDGNRDIVRRLVGLSHAEVAERLSSLSDGMVETEDMDDMMDEPYYYEVRLYVPESFGAESARLMKELVHEYIVCRVLWSWTLTTNPSGAEQWFARLTKAGDEIDRVRSSRRGTFRRVGHPF